MIGPQTTQTASRKPKSNPPRVIAPFTPLDWHVTPWRDTSPVMLLTGSAGGGKSRLAAEKMHGYMLRYPGSTGLIVRKTRSSMTNSTVLFIDGKVIGNDPNVKHFSSKSRFEYANGSILVYGGMKDEEQREQIRSIGQDGSLDIAWMEEATGFIRDDYQEIRARMRGKAAPWQQIMLTTNPDHPRHWINTDLIQGRGAQVYYSKASDNPYNSKAYLDILESLTGVLALRLRDGRWVQAEGAVYDDFDPQIHVIEPFPIPSDWRRIRSIDFGFTNPFVCQWWAFDNDDRMYLYREIYQTGRLVEDLAKDIKALSEGETISATISDHDAEDRATLERHGVSTTKAVKDISPGIQAVQSQLRQAGNGKPRLFVFRGATVAYDETLEERRKPTSTEQEFTGYVWPKSRDGGTIKEVPVKENDHGMDALRYACYRGPALSTLSDLAGLGSIEDEGVRRWR